MGNLTSQPSWELEQFDKDGYNPKNGKVMSLFRWNGNNFGELWNRHTKEICPALSFSRPHARVFHFAWFNFFICFIMWFAIAPLMPTLKKPKCQAADSPVCTKCLKDFPNECMKFPGETAAAMKIDGKECKAPKGALDAVCKVCYPYEGRAKGRAGCGGLGLTDYEVQVSTLVGISGTIVLRVLIGPMSDALGVRVCYAVLLVLTAIPGFLLAASTNFAAIVVFRFGVSLAGASFVLTQLWTTAMFDLTVVGIANATSAGWGNLGGGVSQLLNSAIFAALKEAGVTNDQAWRRTLCWSPAVIFSLGVCTFLFTDDCPFGNFSQLKKKQDKKDAEASEAEALKTGGEPGSVAWSSLYEAATTWQTWVMHLSYCFSFGVELVVNGNITSYFQETYGMTQSEAGMIGSIFGFLNIFARSLGGWMSDLFSARWGLRGRLWALFIMDLGMAICLIVFSTISRDTAGIGGMIVNLVFWSILTNMTEGGTFGVVPYVIPTAIGGVAGITGAGGNVGALLGNAMMVILSRRSKAARNLAFCALGWAGLGSAFLIPCLWIKSTGSMFRSCTQTPCNAPVAETVAEEKPIQVMPTGPTPTWVPFNPAPQELQQLQQQLQVQHASA
jgi:NNP family nitrate/nitrite transporter-like MFS transporter